MGETADFAAVPNIIAAVTKQGCVLCCKGIALLKKTQHLFIPGTLSASQM